MRHVTQGLVVCALCAVSAALRLGDDADAGAFSHTERHNRSATGISLPTAWSGILRYKEVLGEGTFGKATLYELKGCGKQVVVKLIKCTPEAKLLGSRNKFKDSKTWAGWMREVFLMMRLNSENVIKAHSFYPENPQEWCTYYGDGKWGDLQIMMQPAMGGEIWNSFSEKIDEIAPYSIGGGMTKFFQKYSPFNEVKIARREAKGVLLSMMLVRTLRGLTKLHKGHWIHGDIKPANIWSTTPTEEAETCVDNLSCNWVLGDLGLVMRPPLKLKVNGKAMGVPCHPALSGTPSFMPLEAMPDALIPVMNAPPSQWNGQRGVTCGGYPAWTYRGDIYALGYALMTSVVETEESFQSKTHYVHVQQVRSEFVSKSYLPAGLRQILKKMTQHDMGARYSWAEPALQDAEKYFVQQYGRQIPEKGPESINCAGAWTPMETQKFEQSLNMANTMADTMGQLDIFKGVESVEAPAEGS